MEKAKAERVAKMELAKPKLDIRASRHSNVVPQRSAGSADGQRYRLRAGQLCLHATRHAPSGWSVRGIRA